MESDSKTTIKHQVELPINNPLQNSLAKVDEDRISKWEEKRSATKSPFQHFIENPGEKEVHLGFKFPKDDQLTHGQKSDLVRNTFSAATGSVSVPYATRMFEQTINAIVVRKIESSSEDTNAIFSALLSLNPQDEIEGMLCTRLIVLQDQYMEYMKRAKNADDTRIIDANINRATKLMRLYNETLQLLHKHRRKGEDQRVVVQHQHITVNDGGKAVGVHATGGGGNNKN